MAARGGYAPGVVGGPNMGGRTSARQPRRCSHHNSHLKNENQDAARGPDGHRGSGPTATVIRTKNPGEPRPRPATPPSHKLDAAHASRKPTPRRNDLRPTHAHRRTLTFHQHKIDPSKREKSTFVASLALGMLQSTRRLDRVPFRGHSGSRPVVKSGTARQNWLLLDTTLWRLSDTELTWCVLIALPR